MLTWLHSLPLARGRYSLSLGLILTFLLPHFLWAFQAEHYAPPRQVDALTIDPNHGTILERFQGQGRLVILIQDLHCQGEAQKKIATLIDDLARRHWADLVCIEGAWLPLNVTKLAEFPLPSVRTQTADALLASGRLTGAEWAAALGRHPLPLEGIEDHTLYMQELAAIRLFLNDESLGYIEDLRNALSLLKSDWYSPELRAWDAYRTAFRQNLSTPQQYLRQLRRTGETVGLSAADQARATALAAQPDLDALNPEIDVLEEHLRERLYRQPREKELDAHGRRLETLENLLNISATAEELLAFRQAPEQYHSRTFRNFLNTHLPEQTDLDLSETSALDTYLHAADEFYRVADLRSEAFVTNTLNKLDPSAAHSAILITGGFHAGKITERLRQQDISYISIKPRVRFQDTANRYFEILRGRKTPLEKALAARHALAPPLASPQVVADPMLPLLPESLPAEQRAYYQLVDTLNLINLSLASELQANGELDLERVAEFWTQWTRTHPGAPTLGPAYVAGRTILIPLLGADRTPLAEPLTLVLRPDTPNAAPLEALHAEINGNYRCELAHLSAPQEQALLKSGRRAALWASVTGRLRLLPSVRIPLQIFGTAAYGLYLWGTGDFSHQPTQWAMMMGVLGIALTDRPALNRLQEAWQKGEVSKTAQVFDLHGRTGVLDQVLRDVKAGAITEVIFHGDAFDRTDKGNLRVFEQLKELKQLLGERCVLLMGNHDAFLIEGIALNSDEALARWIYYEGDGIFNELGLRLDFHYHNPADRVFGDASGFKGFRRAYMQRRQNSNLYDYALMELKALLQKPRARKLREMALWMMENQKLYHVDDKGWMHLHAGLPLNAQGDPLFTAEQLETLQQTWARVTKNVASGQTLDAPQVAELQSVLKTAQELFKIRPEDWVEPLVKNGKLTLMLQNYGLQGIMVGHTENHKPTVHDQRVIIGDVPETYMTSTPEGIHWVKPNSRERQELVSKNELIARIAETLKTPGSDETGHAFTARTGFLAAWGARIFALLQFGALALGSAALPGVALPLMTLSIFLGGYVWVAGAISWVRMGTAVQNAVLEAIWTAERPLQNQTRSGALTFADFTRTPGYAAWQQEALPLPDGRTTTRLQLAQAMPVAFQNGFRLWEVMHLLKRSDAQGGNAEHRRAVNLVEQHETFRNDVSGMVGLMPQVRTASVLTGMAFLALGLGLLTTAGIGLLPVGLMLAGVAGLTLPVWLRQQQAPVFPRGPESAPNPQRRIMTFGNSA